MAHKSTMRVPITNRIFRIRDVMEFTGKRHNQIKREVAKGEFPKPIPLTVSGRAIGWLEEDLIAWREGCIKAREANAKQKAKVQT